MRGVEYIFTRACLGNAQVATTAGVSVWPDKRSRGTHPYSSTPWFTDVVSRRTFCEQSPCFWRNVIKSDHRVLSEAWRKPYRKRWTSPHFGITAPTLVHEFLQSFFVADAHWLTHLNSKKNWIPRPFKSYCGKAVIMLFKNKKLSSALIDRSHVPPRLMLWRHLCLDPPPMNPVTFTSSSKETVGGAWLIHFRTVKTGVAREPNVVQNTCCLIRWSSISQKTLCRSSWSVISYSRPLATVFSPLLYSRLVQHINGPCQRNKPEAL